MAVIDVHTHMMNDAWVAAIGGHPNYGLVETSGKRMIALDGRPYMPVEPEMLDYDQRIRDMDQAGVDMAIVSLTTPSVYWAKTDMAVRLTRTVNDDMADRQATWPDRIRYLATLPWQDANAAIAELDHAVNRGAVGVFVGANIAGLSLTDSSLAPIWTEINKRALPVLVHPAPLPVRAEMNLNQYNLVQAVGFMCDTTLALTRMIFDGFFDTYPNLKLIAAHVGGTLPFIAGRLDACFEFMEPCREHISTRPSEYLRRIYYDSIGYTKEAIELCIRVGGLENVMFGSDYPHLIGHMGPAIERVKSLAPETHAPIFDQNTIRIFAI
ncbi:MAG: amidohydrolase family protein [Pseudomonadota bacterium]|nr:amidohydrolase family protein [Pseudomonadota bacterium]